MSEQRGTDTPVKDQRKRSAPISSSAFSFSLQPQTKREKTTELQSPAASATRTPKSIRRPSTTGPNATFVQSARKTAPESKPVQPTCVLPRRSESPFGKPRKPTDGFLTPSRVAAAKPRKVATPLSSLPHVGLISSPLRTSRPVQPGGDQPQASVKVLPDEKRPIQSASSKDQHGLTAVLESGASDIDKTTESAKPNPLPASEKPQDGGSDLHILKAAKCPAPNETPTRRKVSFTTPRPGEGITPRPVKRLSLMNDGSPFHITAQSPRTLTTPTPTRPTMRLTSVVDDQDSPFRLPNQAAREHSAPPKPISAASIAHEAQMALATASTSVTGIGQGDGPTKTPQTMQGISALPAIRPDVAMADARKRRVLEEEGVGVSPRKKGVIQHQGPGPPPSIRLAALLSSTATSLVLFYTSLQHTLGQSRSSNSATTAVTTRSVISRHIHASAPIRLRLQIDHPPSSTPIDPPVDPPHLDPPNSMSRLDVLTSYTHPAILAYCRMMAWRVSSCPLPPGLVTVPDRVLVVFAALPPDCPQLGLDVRVILDRARRAKVEEQGGVGVDKGSNARGGREGGSSVADGRRGQEVYSPSRAVLPRSGDSSKRIEVGIWPPFTHARTRRANSAAEETVLFVSRYLITEM